MEQKKTCEICNRLYKIPPLEYPTYLPHTSSFHIKLREPHKTFIFSGDVCPNCARELMWHIKTMKRNAPKKCDFCQFDRGPLHEHPQPECRACVKHSNFQLKKPMSVIEKIRWDHFNGDLDNSPKAINERLKR